MSDTAADGLVGPVTVGPVAHGGHCVARLDGRVIFVRHALPGEVVRVRLTDVSKPRLWRGDAVEILSASPDRVTPRCPVAAPGLCGGCDWQHATLAAQRELKRSVVAEQLSRLAGITWDGVVEPASVDGFGWRTRMRYVADQGRLCMRAHRSHDLVSLPQSGCAISASPPPVPPDWYSGEVEVAGIGDETSVVADGTVVEGPEHRFESAAGRSFEVAADGFWQVHPNAPDILATAVLEGLAPTTGDRALDLYCGVGLFAGALAARGVRVHGVESWAAAAEMARRNVPEATFTAARVDRYLSRHRGPVDLVVLDPPRTGARAEVVTHIGRLRPRAVAYVACDPAALARDLATFEGLGYVPRTIRAYDLFPQTHHVECVATLVPA